jgi:septum formation protein
MSAQLILASTSRYRQSLLQRLQVPFETVAPAVDESPRAPESPGALAARLARAKAQAVALRHPQAVVIGSDQVASLDEQILGKPGDEQRAVAQLMAASGRRVDFFTAVAVASEGGREVHAASEHTRVTFRRLSQPQVREYVRREQPLDCAGAFRCEGLGIALFEQIESTDPTALIGLPLIALCSLLARAGIEPLHG